MEIFKIIGASMGIGIIATILSMIFDHAAMDTFIVLGILIGSFVISFESALLVKKHHMIFNTIGYIISTLAITIFSLPFIGAVFKDSTFKTLLIPVIFLSAMITARMFFFENTRQAIKLISSMFLLSLMTMTILMGGLMFFSVIGGANIQPKYSDTEYDVSTYTQINTERSSFIQDARYYSKEEHLIMQLSSTYYEYCGVPVHIWEGFEAASSLGRFYNEYIKNNYPCN